MNPTRLKQSLYVNHSTRSSNGSESLVRNPSSVELPWLNPEICLGRSTLLEQDRKKSFRSFLSQKLLNDVSHLFDSEKVTVSVDSRPNLSENFYINKDSLKRLPTGRLELENLEKWLKSMKETQLPDLDKIINSGIAPKPEVIEKVEKIYIQALNEITRQISVQSKTRGDLLSNVIETLKYTWKKYPEYLTHVIHKDKENFTNTLENLKHKYEDKIEKYKNLAVSSEKRFEGLKEDKEKLLAEVSSLKKYISKMHWEYEEFLKFKSKKTRALDKEIQTDLSEDITLENSIQTDESPISPKCNYETKFERMPSIKSQQLLRKISIREPDMDKEEFLIELKSLLKDIEIQQDINLEKLLETIASERKYFREWINGFKLAMNLKNEKNNEEAALLKSKSGTEEEMNNIVLIKKNETLRMSARKAQIVKYNTIVDQNIFQHAKEQITSQSILDYINSKSMLNLQKYSKITKRKLLKHVSQYIYLGIGKKISKNFTFADLIFQSLYNKYNIKSIAERKFKEIIVGCLIDSTENIRIKLFLQCLGSGYHAKLKNFSIEACELYFKCYEFMMSSKTGVIFENSDPLYIKFYPTSRAIECVRSRFEHIFSRSRLFAIQSQIEKLSENDPNHINKTGVIDLDKFIQVLVYSFEEFRECIINGVNLSTKIITEYNYLTRREIVILLRHLAQNKQGSIKSVPLDEKGEIDVSEFRNFCIGHGILSIEIVEEYFRKVNLNSKEILEKIEGAEREIVEILKIHNGETLTLEEWQEKFEDFRFKLRGINNEKYLQLWHLLSQEMEYLRNY